MPLTVAGFGPFLKGITDGANTSTDLRGFLRWARHAALSGAGRMMAGPGSAVAITLMDDQGTPAACTAVLEIVPFGDGCLAVAHSTVTDKVYLYRLDSGLTGWYNLAGAFTASATATPLGALWTSVTDPPAVTISEILGEAWICHNQALTSSTLDWPTKVFTGTAINTLTSDIDGTGGAETVYALGTFAYQGHRWIWGFDKGAVAATAYRPELLRFGGPDGGSMTDDGRGSFTVGHRIRSAREAIVGACVAGEVAYVGTTFSLWPIVGYGRDTWDKSHPLDDSFGFVSLKGQVSADNGVLYYWSPRGPCRVAGLNKPEPLWDALPETIPTIVDPQKIVASVDPDRDQVLWHYRGGTKTGNQLLAAYDYRRDVFLGPDTDQGFAVGAAGLVAPVQAAAAAGSAGPSGPPTTPSTTSVGSSSAIANWVNADINPDTTTVIQYREQGTSTWQAGGTVGSGVTSFTLTSLAVGTPYEWRAHHVRNSQSSSELGPSAPTQFTTSGSSLSPPTNCTLTDYGPATSNQGYVEWTNSGESGVSTEVRLEASLKTTVGPGVSSAFVSVNYTDVYGASVRHIKTSYSPSSYAFSNDTQLTYSSCVAPETEILVLLRGAHSSRLARDLAVGDYVLTYPEDSSELGAYLVTQASTHTARRVRVTFEDGRVLECSAPHRLRLTSGAWREAQDLEPLDFVFGAPAGVVASVEEIGEGPVVQLKVDGAQTYLSAGLLSHNVKELQ